MKLYLLRHAHRGVGEKLDTLTELGKDQVKRVSKYFRNKKIDKIICGVSQRARKTAEPIIEEKDVEVEFTSDVNEQSMGVFEGKSGREWKEAVLASGLLEQDFRPEGGENRRDAYNRAKSFFEKLKNEKVENLLIVSHSGFISDLITFILNLDEKESLNFKTGFCAISYFELDSNLKPISFYIGDLSHLVP